MSSERLPEMPEGAAEPKAAAPVTLLAGFPLDLEFLGRVYRTALVLLLVVAVLAWERFGRASALGWLVGGTLSLLMLWGVELAVRSVLKPGSRSAGALIGATLAKILVAALVLFFSLVAATRGWINLWWVLGGFSIPHAVVVLKLIGQWVRRAGRE